MSPAPSHPPSQPSERDDLPGEAAKSGARVHSRSKALALPFGTSPLDSEEGRAFLQQRLALFAKVIFIIGGFACIATLLLHLGLRDQISWVLLEAEGVGWHLIGVVASFAAWQLARRGHLTVGQLFVLDGVGTLLILGAYSAMGFRGASQAPERASLLMMLITMCTVTLRAITVPSTPGHTLSVTGLGSIPVLALTYHSAATYPSPGSLPPLVNMGFMSIWVVICLTITGVTSQVIYGLRAQIAQAQRLGQYVLDDLIGEGGMGVVYKARHALLRRPTAIKLLLPERAGAQMLRRFEREVQLTAMLTHPNTVNIYDYGRTADGIFYYAMEYLDGINLEQLVDEFGFQDSRRVVSILEQVAGSLSEAHTVGLVHRDIKPANVILCNRGGLPDIAKVVDFGLVKDANEMGRGELSMTSINAIIGTPMYLAPEGIMSPNSVDGRSDLYALGAVGYFLLTGQPVFTGSSVIEICVQHVNAKPVPPSIRLGRTISQPLETLILQCLAKDPDARPQSAETFLSHLAACHVEKWPREEAAAWWNQHAARLSRSVRSSTRRAPSTVGRETVAVDFVDRSEAPRRKIG